MSPSRSANLAPTSLMDASMPKRSAKDRTIPLGSRALPLACVFTILATSIGAFSQARAQSGGAAKAPASNCAALGAGFVAMPGSDTCVKVQAAVRAEAYGGGTMSNARGLGNTATDLGMSSTTGTSNTASDPWKQAR